jgi:hypothetical protein
MRRTRVRVTNASSPPRLTPPAAPLGVHSIVASYLGDGNYAGSTLRKLFIKARLPQWLLLLDQSFCLPERTWYLTRH